MKQNSTSLLYTNFALTVFLSAFLLFQVQPIIGKYILPWFGGSSFVWITSLLFFQTLLLAGYFYSYILTKLSIKQQLVIHSILVLLTAAVTATLFFHWSSPITPSIGNELPDTVSPVFQVLGVLLISVGLPYFLLSTTSTLLQQWFSKLPHKKSPYPLYALSNAGSLLAIITYPFFIEPFFALQNQGFIWSFIFILLCIILLISVAQIFTFTKNASLQSVQKSKLAKITYKKKQFFLWLFLPAVSSMMLLSGTQQLTQGIAPIPFLWLLPLGLYLLSFILCFSERHFYKRNLYAYIFLPSMIFVLAILISSPVLGIVLELFVFSALLFSCFMLCHGELFAIRPEPNQLNIFYLIMALGSVLGALVVAIIAPIFFVGLFWEFLLGLFLTSLVVAFVLVEDKNNFFYRKLNSGYSSQKEITLFFVSVACVFFAIIFVASYIEQTKNSLGIFRNFYSTLRLYEPTSGKTKCLLNGKIIHGCQLLAPKDSMKPTTYYGEKSIGLAIKSLREKTPNLRIGAIGLGVGTIAAYGEKDDALRFYELNPLDVKIAKTYFTFLSGTPAKTEIIVGDGRLSMEKELLENKKQNYNLIVVDAFNDDAIPVHLLTKEAFNVYRAHLAPESIIAVHISNTYLDLAPVIKRTAEYNNMHIVFIDAPPSNSSQTRSKWAFLSDDNTLLTTPELNKSKHIKIQRTDIKLWTDQYSNLFQIFKYTP